MKHLTFLLIILAAISCNSNNNVQSQVFDPNKGLKDYYKDYFPIGVSFAPKYLKTDEAGFVAKQFNSISAENVMKMGLLQPKEKQFYWKDADSIVAFAKRNKMKIRGHVLVWHQQTPDWLYTDKNGNTVSKEVLLQRLKDHITTVVKRYKDDIYAWDVVNEAISDSKDTFYRQSMIYKICGEEYIAKAFEWAHAADPDAILFYNDYNETDPVKRAKIISLVTKLRANGVPVHAIGLQGHWTINEPTKAQLEKTLSEFSAVGLPLQVTELDMSVYPTESKPWMKKATDFDTTYTAEREEQQTEQYKMIFELLRKYRKHITGVTFWNISDRHSWLDLFPIKDRKNYPLLFDKNLQPKKAYYEVINF